MTLYEFIHNMRRMDMTTLRIEAQRKIDMSGTPLLHVAKATGIDYASLFRFMKRGKSLSGENAFRLFSFVAHPSK